MKIVYMDHSATTPVHPEVLEAMLPYFSTFFGNASSIHKMGRDSRNAVAHARLQLAELIGARPEEIVFTGGGTEANNFAILGAAEANREKGNHIITSAIEHHAVLHPCAELEKRGYRVTYLLPDRDGLIRPEDVSRAVQDDTIMISIMHVNNEVGTIQPLAQIGRIARERGILFHTDAIQSLGKIPVRVDELQVDLMSMSAHKIYGPKGVGALYVRRNTRIVPVAFGGGQERKRRPGTENVPGIVGFGRAAEVARRDMAGDAERITALRNKLIDGIFASIDDVQLNGHREQRIPGNANIWISFVEGESLLLMLDMKNIAVSSGSACMSGSTDPSHVLLAMGVPAGQASSSLRFTLGKDNTGEEVDYVLEQLPPMVQRLRAVSPAL